MTLIEGLVTTIIPVHNRAGMLREAVASVLGQTFRPIEIIIVDDGSTDDTGSTAEQLAAGAPQPVSVLHQANAGPGAARQAGLALARGEFVQFLDSDDVLLPRKFALQVRALRNDPEAGVAYGKTYSRIDGIRCAEPAKRTSESHRQLFPALLVGRIWDTSTPLYRRSVLDSVGPWVPRRQLEDWEFESRVGAARIPLCSCEEYVSETRHHFEPRACNAWLTNPEAMKDRVAAYLDVLERATQAGVNRDTPEMKTFVRSLFWMARNAGRYGLATEARGLFDAARRTSLGAGWEFGLFRCAAAVMGWRTASALSEAVRMRLDRS